MHTHQETFDVVARGILAQGGPGMEDGKVVYLATNGRRCGAGQAMDLDLFRPEVNHNTVFMAAMVVPDLEVMNKHGVVTRFARRGDVFKPAAGLGTRSQKQVLALLRGAHAFCVRAAGA